MSSWRETEKSKSDATESEHIEVATTRPQKRYQYPDPEPIRAGPGLNPATGEGSASSHSSGHSKLFKGPDIRWGDQSSAPRWLIRPLRKDPGDQPVEPELGILQWVFDAGGATPYRNWSQEKLYEFAYRFLETALNLPQFREHIRDSIRKGPFAPFVVNVEDPVPVLPSAPRSALFENHRLLETSSIGGGRFLFPGYERPSMASRPVEIRRLQPIGLNARTLVSPSQAQQQGSPTENRSVSIAFGESASGCPNPEDIPLPDSTLPSTRSGSSSQRSGRSSKRSLSEYEPGDDNQLSSSEEESLSSVPSSNASVTGPSRVKTRAAKASKKQRAIKSQASKRQSTLKYKSTRKSGKVGGSR